MAKIRIYELARELNMKNKELLDKIVAMDIEAKSHMSSLDDDAVEKIRAALFGKQADMIEETRVKPTVIRRRRKAVEAELVETDAPEVEAETKESAEAVAEQPEAVVVEAAASAAEVEKTVDQAESEKEEMPEIPEEQASTEAVEKEEIAAVEPEKVESEKDVSAKKAKPVKKKKVKKDSAAKIINLPVKPKVTPPEEKPKAPERETARNKKQEAKVQKLPRPKEVPDPVVLSDPDSVKGKDKKRKRKGKVEEVQDPRFFKKKISFRKKEVIEGDALYANIPRRGRKTRKAVKASSVRGQKPQITTPKAIKRRIKIDDTILLTDLAKRMGIKANEMIAKLMTMGVMATVNQTIDFETATLVANEFDYELERAAFEEETVIKVVKDDPEKLVPRPPVVTIMGHVDHGKTSLLDVIRKTRVTEGEAGGITQHIGAYHVPTAKGNIVFLDTPGHEAFTAMRSRGAKVTDIVILVVAADDGVMPQTVEAINHAKAAGVPIIVAVNKIDKENADPERVFRELAEENLVPEEWGGDTIFIKVSAKTHEGLDGLLEMILLQSEMLELKANPDKAATGHVVEAKLDAGRGPVATVLVQEGTLRTGDPIVCGVHYGKVRALLDDMGAAVESAGPAMPVEVIGLTGVPMAGDELMALNDEKSARQVSVHRIQKHRSTELAKTSRLSLDRLYENLKSGETKDLNLIIKADVNGSIEALRDSLTKQSNEEVNINVVHSAAGTITESDVSLATVSNAIVIGFNVRPSQKVIDFAAEEHVDMRFYNIIYEVIKDIQGAIVGMMDSSFEERILGRADVREVFHIPKVGAVAGCYVTDGKVERSQLVRVLRDGVITYEGKIASLRRFKDDAREVQNGYECGIGIDKFNDIKVGDVFECYYLEEIKPEIQA